MKNLTNNQWWKQARWDGCLARPSNIQRAAAAAPEKFVLPQPFAWYKFAIPTINQHGPSCCCQAWANVFEMSLRRYIGPDVLKDGEQIDGYAAWERARDMFYGGNKGGGLFLWQGFEAMLDLGIFPPGTQLVEIEPELEAICDQLQISPMVQGHIVTDGWYDTNPENGCLDHSKLPKPGDRGHATTLYDITVSNDTPFTIFQNSWGPDYGIAGSGVMSWDFWKQCYIGEGPCSPAFPSGWTSYDGWRKYVTRNAQ